MNDYLSKWCCLIVFNGNQNNADPIINISSAIDCTKHFYFDKNFVETNPVNSNQSQNYLLDGNDLTTQIQNAFKNAFGKGFRKVVLIRDNFDQVQPSHIIEAFNCLKMIEFCIGPKDNGNYYLIGMNYFEPSLFNNKQWDSPTLTKEIIKDIGKLKLALYKLPTLKTEENVTAVNT